MIFVNRGELLVGPVSGSGQGDDLVAGDIDGDYCTASQLAQPLVIEQKRVTI